MGGNLERMRTVKTLGEKIRERREALGMTQIQLGEMVGITNRTINSYECAGSVPRGHNVSKLCRALKVSEAYLTNPEIEDPSYGLEEAPYIEAVRESYGKKGAMDMQQLLEANQAMFAGGDVPQEDKDKFFEAVMRAYVVTKQDAKATFTPKKYRK